MMVTWRASVGSGPVSPPLSHHRLLQGNGQCSRGARLGFLNQHLRFVSFEKAKECSRVSAYNRGNNGSLNGRFHGSENGFSLPPEEADPFTFSPAMDSFSIKVEEDYNDVQDSFAASSMKRSLSGCASIKVFGVGGGGCNAVDEMVRSELLNVEFWAVNTDKQALNKSLAPNKIQIGQETTAGRGAGGKGTTGEEAATESLAELSMALEGADLVFIASGMGGGTGSGAAPVVARLAKAMGALTIGIVTEPFTFEGFTRARQARKAIEDMRHAADTVVVVPNDRLLQTVSPDTSMLEAFHLADDVLRQGVQGISDIITIPGLVNVDFADVKAIMSNAGSAMLGIGAGFGKNRAEEVARSAIMSPLLRSISRPMGIVYNVTGGSDLTLHEVNIAAEIVHDMADPNANVIFGAVIDESFKGMIRMTVIATGFREPGDAKAVSSVRTVDDDIFFWEQNPKRAADLGKVPDFLRKKDRKRRRRPTLSLGCRGGRRSCNQDPILNRVKCFQCSLYSKHSSTVFVIKDGAALVVVIFERSVLSCGETIRVQKPIFFLLSSNFFSLCSNLLCNIKVEYRPL